MKKPHLIEQVTVPSLWVPEEPETSMGDTKLVDVDTQKP